MRDVTRRDFLRAALGTSTLMSLGSSAPDFLVRAARAPAPSRDRDTVLVVIQLTGGNDGLNTVVPYADDEYARNRTTLRLPEGRSAQDRLAPGLPSSHGGISAAVQGRHLSVVQGVGYPNSDRSHDRAMRIWHTADPERPARQTGWLGRVADHAWGPGNTDAAAVFVGSIDRPFALNAENVVVPSIRSCQDLILASNAW